MKIHHSINEVWITWSQKELAKPNSESQIYILEKEITDSRVHLYSSNLEMKICILLYFISPFENILLSMLTAECLHLVLNFSTEYHNSEQNIVIMF
jgi:hypothetical protein